jgi:hypothetical protein
MEEKTIKAQKKALIEHLSPLQKEYFEAVDWLFNGARATGRTHLICVVALIHVLNGQDGYVIDHYPLTHDGIRGYTKALLLNLADSIDLRVKVSDTRNGFVVYRVPEAYEYIERLGK